MNQIITGDCLPTLKTLQENSIDLLVTDPPYGYSFMGKDWDKAVPSVDIWKECLRVLKPGAFAFVMSAPRQDVLSQMIVRLGMAGFDTSFTSIYWTYASGFPKAMNMGKKTEDKALDGSYAGFQPKPAVEVIIVCMKPLSEKTYVEQALTNQKGITWLDDCRIPYQSEDTPKAFAGNKRAGEEYGELSNVYELSEDGTKRPYFEANPQGRFPANLLVNDDVLNDGRITKGTRQLKAKAGDIKFNGNDYAGGQTYNEPNDRLGGYNDSGSYSRYFDLDKWAEKTLPFLIVPKASKSEKDRGLDDLPEKEVFSSMNTHNGTAERFDGAPTPKARNTHPTVKPLKLMSYLITMGSRQGDLILDPFSGSGTTCIAAKTLGRNYVGIELSEEYANIARKRLEAVTQTTL